MPPLAAWACWPALLVWLASAPLSCRGEVVGAAILPHGDIALDPTRDPQLNETQRAQAEDLQAAAGEAGRFLAGLDADIFLLTSPHGIADLQKHAFFLNPTAAGCLDPPPTCQSAQDGNGSGGTSGDGSRGGSGGGSGSSSSAPASSPSGSQCTCANVSVAAAESLGLLKYLQDR